jgi:hypothetical protein
VKLAALAALAASLAFGTVDGTVRNGTTGKPQAGVPVVLVAMGGAGMAPRATATTGGAGAFRFDASIQGAALLQATYQGVVDNLVGGSGAPPSGLPREVFAVPPRRGAAKVAEDVVILEPLGAQLSVRQNVVWRNPGKETYRDAAAGTLRFWAPAEAKDSLRVTATAPGGLPVEQTAEAAGEPGVYKVDFPIKPGDTVFEITYTAPFTAPGPFAGRTLQKDAPLRLAVPAGVTMKGAGLTLLGQEPQSRASVYGVAGQQYQVELEGSGSMAAAAPAEDEADSGLAQILPRVYDNVYAIVGFGLTILALGFAMLLRRNAPAAGSGRFQAAPAGQRKK